MLIKQTKETRHVLGNGTAGPKYLGLSKSFV
jgi:hypothetical protein